MKTSDGSYDVFLRSDNDDALPKFWRQWFYFKLDDVPVGRPVALTIKGAGHWSYYVPVFSYDDETWQSFPEASVTKPSRLQLKISTTFKKPTVWLARYNPYTYSDLNAYLQKVKWRVRDSKVATIASLGRTPQGRDIPKVTITNPRGDRAKRPRVMIHARTHPGEVGSSFLLEGLVDALTAPTAAAAKLRDKLVFEIVPMLNVDGVVAGNNRVTPQGLNLEGKWYTRPGKPLELDTAKAPHEVKLLHTLAREAAAAPKGVSMALNLHASAGEPDDNVFFFPHFGPRTLGYTQAEHGLFNKQLAFIGRWLEAHGPNWFNPPPKDGTRAFLAKAVPETWWWKNYGDKVMALSIESTYGRAANGRRWVTPADMRKMGVSLAKAIGRYHEGK